MLAGVLTSLLVYVTIVVVKGTLLDGGTFEMDPPMLHNESVKMFEVRSAAGNPGAIMTVGHGAIRTGQTGE